MIIVLFKILLDPQGVAGDFFTLFAGLLPAALALFHMSFPRVVEKNSQQLSCIFSLACFLRKANFNLLLIFNPLRV
jgi:hypothetical protein